MTRGEACWFVYGFLFGLGIGMFMMAAIAAVKYGREQWLKR